jgi:SAM-dependent methyltransferase
MSAAPSALSGLLSGAELRPPAAFRAAADGTFVPLPGREPAGLRLNLGCGRDIREGWVNVDAVPAPGVDHVVNFDDKPVLPLPDDAVAYSEGSHVIEHLRDPLPFMEELWRVTRPGGLAVFRCPYGSTDDADEDPTHVRRMLAGSWGYFGMPHFWRADYGYRGDWQPSEVTLVIFPELADCTDGELRSMIRFQRNVVAEMTASLRCVKPRREPRRELQEDYVLKLLRTA